MGVIFLVGAQRNPPTRHRLGDKLPTPVRIETIDGYAIALEKLPQFFGRSTEYRINIESLAYPLNHSGDRVFPQHTLPQGLLPLLVSGNIQCRSKESNHLKPFMNNTLSPCLYVSDRTIRL